eukprot:15431701-Alexandrium_andersonii.AAC.1
MPSAGLVKRSTTPLLRSSGELQEAPESLGLVHLLYLLFLKAGRSGMSCAVGVCFRVLTPASAAQGGRW